ncbi:MAG: DUF2752 domain-containing protein [Lachnospiraceae bacterium]|nr:DUF2752 domain-containing protein [Lachnospiraceae bacterium]
MFIEFLSFVKKYIEAGSPCIFHAVTGLYCPGCGGTRAVLLLLHGHPLLSFIYHPLVLYMAILCLYIILRHSYDALRTRSLRIERFYLKPRMVWTMLFIVIANFLIKNIALIFLHLDLLQ